MTCCTLPASPILISCTNHCPARSNHHLSNFNTSAHRDLFNHFITNANCVHAAQTPLAGASTWTCPFCPQHTIVSVGPNETQITSPRLAHIAGCPSAREVNARITIATGRRDPRIPHIIESLPHLEGLLSLAQRAQLGLPPTQPPIRRAAPTSTYARPILGGQPLRVTRVTTRAIVNVVVPPSVRPTGVLLLIPRRQPALPVIGPATRSSGIVRPSGSGPRPPNVPPQ